ncbi:hypothetical protein MJ923_14325 [Shewanella sp. 3B26]|jgi:hypothetical protein|uniref:EfeO-type cupredoxin-like domain-containing protein n=1 Tax=Shewanella zhuhaiensis TaxID=2919576 RepID=A0AAJ1BIP1_9GAMM|nr:hypothetical protein [Shewanella zhuhaiensis]MCH4295480.1 hypothetical protein [Shewanella zhuhaiensis]
MKNLFKSIVAAAGLLMSLSTFAATPTVGADGVTDIYLEQHGGHFSARDTLASLKPGKYRFVITNKAGKLVGFQLQNFTTHEPLDMFPLEVGETRTSDVVNVTAEGVRFRCPINPTPWYDMDVISAK